MAFGAHTDRSKPTPLTGAERYRRYAARAREIELPPVADLKRRKRFERPGREPAWMLHYMPAAYPAPFSPGHLSLIRNTIHAARTGEGTATAQPRGEGKTSVLRGVCAYLLATGVVRFPVLVGWKHSDAAAAFNSWLRMLCESPEFSSDYPEIATPYTYSTHATALKSLVWKHTGERIGASVDTMNKMIILPDSLGAVAARSAQGDAKGLNATLHDGTILRPDFLLIDDAQDPKAADNPTRVAATVDALENVFLGMAGPQKRLSAAAACTVEADDDVSCHWLSRQGWTSTRISRIAAWPDGSTGGTWESKKDCPLRALWDQWREIYIDPEQGQKPANTFFRKRRKMMTGKMKVSWKHRFDKAHDVCAIDAAMRDWYHLGADVFARGQQNQPLKVDVSEYMITAKMIMSRADNGRPPHTIPEAWSAVAVNAVATDINHYGLHSAQGAFAKDASAAVLWYGNDDAITVPKNAPEQQRKAIIYEMLMHHKGIIERLQNKPGVWGIDGGYELDTAIKFAKQNQIAGTRVIVIRGYPGTSYRPIKANLVGKPFEQCHMTDWRTGRGLAFNSHYWHEIAQRAWLGSIGAPGACSLFAGVHREFAEQICREILREKFDGKYGPVWNWATLPGWHDYGDCMAMLYAIAASQGTGTGGQVARPSTGKRKTRRVRHVEI